MHHPKAETEFEKPEGAVVTSDGQPVYRMNN